MFLCVRPFYRTEQLIITAKNSSQWLKEPVGQGERPPQLWGPVLRIEILEEVG